MGPCYQSCLPFPYIPSRFSRERLGTVPGIGDEFNKSETSMRGSLWTAHNLIPIVWRKLARCDLGRDKWNTHRTTFGCEIQIRSGLGWLSSALTLFDFDGFASEDVQNTPATVYCNGYNKTIATDPPWKPCCKLIKFNLAQKSNLRQKGTDTGKVTKLERLKSQPKVSAGKTGVSNYSSTEAYQTIPRDWKLVIWYTSSKIL